MDMELQFLLEQPKIRCRESYIKKYFPVEYNEIVNFEGKKFSEKIYRYFHHEDKNLGVCKICGRPTYFQNINKGFCQTCCRACAYQDESRTKKIEETKREKYGDPKYNNREKFLKTMGDTSTWGFGNREEFIKMSQEKYGVDNPSRNEEVKAKRAKTCMANHGVPSILCLKETRELGLNAIKEKYGTDITFQVKEIRDKAIKSRRKNFLKDNEYIIDILSDGSWICKCPHPECLECQEKQYITTCGTYHDRKRTGTELCTKLLSVGHYNQNTTLEQFVQHILSSHKINFQTNVRNIIQPKEIDIYCPDYKIGIECNGLRWHSDEYQDPQYHRNKFNDCAKQNIQLISLWEDWIINKPEIVESLLLSKFNIYKTKIGARECIIKEINSKECSTFLKENHIQGPNRPNVRLGLYHMGKLVSVMTFNRNKTSWELSRFCNKRNTQVIGAAGKLLKHFILIWRPDSVVSFSSNDISTGELYKTLGFSKYSSSVAYWYVHKKSLKRYHRTSFCKAKLKEMGFDISKTEREIMSDMPYWRIYDSGTTGWKLIPMI